MTAKKQMNTEDDDKLLHACAVFRSTGANHEQALRLLNAVYRAMQDAGSADAVEN